MSDTTGEEGTTPEASNPDSVTSDADFSITNTAPQPATGVGGVLSAAGQIAQAIGAIFSITNAVAQGGQISVLMGTGGKPVGFIQFMPGISIFPGTSLISLLINVSGFISPLGTITGTGIYAGQIAGFGGMTPSQRGGITIYEDTVDAVDLDNPEIGMTLEGTAGSPLYLSFYPAHVWGQCAGVGVGGAIQWPAERTWSGVGADNSGGVPMLNATALQAMCSKQNSFMLPDFIGGKDGIYSMRTGRRVVPNNQTGAQGFGFGSNASYVQSLMLLAWTAAGRYVLLGSYAEAVNVIDPSTGKTLVPVGYAYVRIYNGSQQINLCPSLNPASAYSGPTPNATAPGYGSTLAGIIGVSNNMANSAILTQQAYQQMVNPANNPGGPDGPGGEGEDGGNQE